jgi:hypothetical protein
MSVTLERMGRKRKDSDPPPEPAKRTTSVIRIETDLARKLAIISTARNMDVTDIVSPLIRPQVERLYAEVVKELGEDVVK